MLRRERKTDRTPLFSAPRPRRGIVEGMAQPRKRASAMAHSGRSLEPTGKRQQHCRRGDDRTVGRSYRGLVMKVKLWLLFVGRAEQCQFLDKLADVPNCR